MEGWFYHSIVLCRNNAGVDYPHSIPLCRYHFSYCKLYGSYQCLCDKNTDEYNNYFGNPDWIYLFCPDLVCQFNRVFPCPKNSVYRISIWEINGRIKKNGRYVKNQVTQTLNFKSINLNFRVFLVNLSTFKFLNKIIKIIWIFTSINQKRFYQSTE